MNRQQKPITGDPADMNREMEAIEAERRRLAQEDVEFNAARVSDDVFRVENLERQAESRKEVMQNNTGRGAEMEAAGRDAARPAVESQVMAAGAKPDPGREVMQDDVAETAVAARDVARPAAEKDDGTNLARITAAGQQTQYQPTRDIFADAATFEHSQRVAKVFAVSSLVPEHMRNLGNVLIAMHIARRLGEDPLMIMWNIYIVNGRPGWKTEYMIARANSSRAFKTRIYWKSRGEGDKLAVTAHAVLADSDQEVSARVDMAMAHGEGWTRNKKYQSMPEHMLRWRSAAMLIRLYCPEVMIGLPTVDELDEMRDVSPRVPEGGSAVARLDAFAGGNGK